MMLTLLVISRAIKGEMASYGDAYFSFWTLFMLGLMGMFSLILSMRGLWRLRRSAKAISH